MSDQNPEIKKIREKIGVYDSLGSLRRLGMWVIGEGPDKQDREILRRHELGPDGRVFEDVVKAVEWTRMLNRTPKAILAGRWVTSSITGDSPSATIPMTLERHSGVKAQLAKLFEDGRESTATDFDGIGFAVRNFSRLLGRKDNVEANQEVIIVAFNDFNAVDAVALSREQIRTMDSSLQGAVAGAASLVERNASMTYARTKPENVG